MPAWNVARPGEGTVPVLRLYNSLTRDKVRDLPRTHEKQPEDGSARLNACSQERKKMTWDRRGHDVANEGGRVQ